MTSLMIAIHFGSSEVVKTEIVDILLRRGADVNITDLVSWYIQLRLYYYYYYYYYYSTVQYDNTSLILACQRNELAIVSTLLEFGANPSVCNKVNYNMHN